MHLGSHCLCRSARAWCCSSHCTRSKQSRHTTEQEHMPSDVSVDNTVGSCPEHHAWFILATDIAQPRACRGDGPCPCAHLCLSNHTASGSKLEQNAPGCKKAAANTGITRAATTTQRELTKLQSGTHCVAHVNKLTVLAKQQLNTQWHCSGADVKNTKTNSQQCRVPQVQAWQPLPSLRTRRVAVLSRPCNKNPKRPSSIPAAVD